MTAGFVLMEHRQTNVAQLFSNQVQGVEEPSGLFRKYLCQFVTGHLHDFRILQEFIKSNGCES